MAMELERKAVKMEAGKARRRDGNSKSIDIEFFASSSDRKNRDLHSPSHASSSREVNNRGKALLLMYKYYFPQKASVRQSTEARSG